MSERRSVVLALPALSQYPAILHRNNRRMFCGLNEAVQANESEAISISDEDHGNPISSVYSENNCVRGRAGGRGRNHRRGRGRGRGRGRDNHDLGGPSRNSSDNRSLRQRCPVLGSQANPRIPGQPSSTNNMVNNDVVEVVNLESYTDEDGENNKQYYLIYNWQSMFRLLLKAKEADFFFLVFEHLDALVYGGLEDLPCWKNSQQMYGDWRKW
ncbi:uncharacterized protein LOC103832259 isoform X2 [Brassica rapa]|uniref:uncharacterized protein LOC103832259 isoform X2 n=1 Tax=Brassica campestris TaxID=3711 RepID=UPI00142E8353|nr:uncharacterized protein LOC103832259 isoform X2 [Brassica rapa]